MPFRFDPSSISNPSQPSSSSTNNNNNTSTRFPTHITHKMSGQGHGDGHGHGHGHGHSCGDDHHDHDHDHGEDTGGEAWSLFEQVDTNGLICLNELEPNSLQHVLRPWHERNNPSLPILTSDADEQLLMCIPFTSPVKIKSVCVIGAGDVENPAKLAAFVNNESMDFAEAESSRAVQEWDLVERNVDGSVEYPTKFTKFQNVSKLWLFVKSNFGGEVTKVMYVGLKGEFTKYKREAVHTVYESRPLKAAKDVTENRMTRMGM